MTPFADALAAIASVARDAGLRWYVFGAQAAIVHGAARVTKDVDVTFELGDLEVPELIARLAAAGLASRASDLAELAVTARVLPLVHVPSDVPVDVVLAGPGLEQEFLARARAVVLAGVCVPVACAEDVVTMKILAGRPTDREDVIAILRARDATFDAGRVRSMLGMLDDALEQGDLVPAFEEALRRAGGA